MTKTEHYQLNQWDASDYVRREDFNEDNRKIEEALVAFSNGSTKIKVGVYIGNGEASKAVDLDVKPTFVAVWRAESHDLHNAQISYWGAAYNNYYTNFQGHPAIQLTNTGFRVYYTTFYYNQSDCTICTNENGVTYIYFALF